MQIIDEVLYVLNRSRNKKLFDLSKQAVENNREGVYGSVGVYFQGLLITPYTLNPTYTSLIIKETTTPSTEAMPYIEAYVKLKSEMSEDSGRFKQLLSVLFRMCKEDHSVFMKNLPPSLVNRLIENIPEFDEEEQYKEAKLNPLFWNQYQKHFIDKVHFIFGSELVM